MLLYRFVLGGEPVTKAERYEQVIEYLKDAAQDPPDLILLPELFETMGRREWNEMKQIEEAEKRRAAVLGFAEPEDGPFAGQIKGFAKRHQLVVVSNNLMRFDETVFNQATFYLRQGEALRRYRKVQPTV